MDLVKACLINKSKQGNDSQHSKECKRGELNVDSDTQKCQGCMCDENMRSGGGYSGLREHLNKSKEYLVPDYMNPWKDRPPPKNNEVESSNGPAPYYDARLIKPAQSKGSYVNSKQITNRKKHFLTKSRPDSIYNESIIDFGNVIKQQFQAAEKDEVEDQDGDEEVPEEGYFINGKKVDVNKVIVYDRRIRQERRGRAEYQKVISQLGASSLDRLLARQKFPPPLKTQHFGSKFKTPPPLDNKQDARRKSSPPPPTRQTSPPRTSPCSPPIMKPCSPPPSPPPLERPPSPKPFKADEIFAAWREESLHAENERHERAQQAKACFRRSYDKYNGNEWAQSYGQIYDKTMSRDYSTGYKIKVVDI